MCRARVGRGLGMTQKSYFTLLHFPGSERCMRWFEPKLFPFRSLSLKDALALRQKKLIKLPTHHLGKFVSDAHRHIVSLETVRCYQLRQVLSAAAQEETKPSLDLSESPSCYSSRWRPCQGENTLGTSRKESCYSMARRPRRGVTLAQYP